MLEREELDFQEILPIFYPEQAQKEAERCLYCYDAPCVKGCPANIDIPHFIQSIRSANYKRAARLINKENPFGAVCGRVCPIGRLCEENCSAQFVTGTPIEIGRLQSFAIEYGNFVPSRAEITKKEKVAVIGSGPAGLSCARELIRKGYEVTVFESKKKAGGMISFGVPQYRCSHEVTANEVNVIQKEGVDIRTATPVNQDVSMLFDKGFSAVFIAIGLTKMSRPDIPGLGLKGVYMGLDFLTRIGAGEIPKIGKKVIVVGGGDTAIDCARSAIRLGAEQSTIMYRRSFAELPSEQEEIEDALEEGVIFRTLTLPVALHGDDQGILRAVESVNIKLGALDESGRRRPNVIKGSSHRLACNNIVFAIGFEPSKILHRLLPKAEFTGMYPKVDPDTYMTSVPGIFCGGDVVNGGATVVEAVADGKQAAINIDCYIEENRVEESPPIEIEEIKKDIVEEVTEKPVEVEAIKEEEPVEVETIKEVKEENLEEDIHVRRRKSLKEKWKSKLKDKKKSSKSDKKKKSGKKRKSKKKK